jgi:hypothetical protein
MIFFFSCRKTTQFSTHAPCSRLGRSYLTCAEGLTYLKRTKPTADTTSWRWGKNSKTFKKHVSVVADKNKDPRHTPLDASGPPTSSEYLYYALHTAGGTAQHEKNKNLREPRFAKKTQPSHELAERVCQSEPWTTFELHLFYVIYLLV